MSPVICPLCGKRVSDWMMAARKTEIINGRVVHKTPCLEEATPSDLAKIGAEDGTKTA